MKDSNFLQHASIRGMIKNYISDFGLAVESGKSPLGTSNLVNIEILDPYSYKKYMELRRQKSQPPEMFAFMSDPKVDTWAYGLMICSLLRRFYRSRNAFDCDKPDEIKKAFGNWRTEEGSTESQEASEKRVEKFINETPFGDEANPIRKDLKNLVLKMMAYDPKNRPSDLEITSALETICEYGRW